jgi:8-oxo-dGTP diphosphatase
VRDFLERLSPAPRERLWARLDIGGCRVMAEAPLYQRDPKAWEAYLAEGNARQARKRVSADALIRDEHGRVMLVDPGYKPGWDMPGGMAEANEPPAECVRRELREELSLDVTLAGLLVVDWISPHGPVG